MATSALEIVERIYEDAREGRWEAVEALMSDDLVIHEAASLPYGGPWRGRDALRRLFGTVMGYWRDPHVAVEKFVADGTTVIALLQLTMTSPKSGRRFTQHIAEVSTVADGLVTEMRVFYFDAVEIVAEAG